MHPPLRGDLACIVEVVRRQGADPASVGDALYRAKITLSTPDVFAWTLVIVLLSAALSAAAAALLRTAKTRLCGEVRV